MTTNTFDIAFAPDMSVSALVPGVRVVDYLPAPAGQAPYVVFQSADVPTHLTAQPIENYLW